LVVLSLLTTSGCAVHRVRADFTGFEKAYADTSNRELLLNLARLQNHDPTYFFKMGQITSSYRMSATIPTSVGYASQSSVSGKSNTTGGATPGLSYESDPLFQFIPVNDETNAQLLLKQIQPETFYILYQQGWRIDQLFRLMIDRIEVTQSTKTSCSAKVYRNVPPAVDDSGAQLDGIKQEELSSYAGFLRASAIAYALQRHGNLVLREISPFVPLDDQAVSAGPSSGGADKGSATGNSPDNKINATDIEKAAEKNFSFETMQPQGGLTATSTESKTLIGQRVPTARFYLIRTPSDNPAKEDQLGTNPEAEVVQEIANDSSLGMAELAQEKGNPPLSAADIFLLAVAKNGFAIEDSEAAGSEGVGCPRTPSPEFNARLVLRSLIGVMSAAAQEQTPFDLIERGPGLLIKDLVEEPAPIPFNEAVPKIERLPILRINWRDGEVKAGPLMPPLTQVGYGGKDYRITDQEDFAPPENKYWNRDVFRLIAALTAQVTVDTSKYPIANILQLNSVQ
jgi:hypothetical protein